MHIPSYLTDYILIDVDQNAGGYSNKVLFAGKYGSAFTRFDFSSLTTDADIYDFNGMVYLKEFSSFIIQKKNKTSTYNI